MSKFKKGDVVICTDNQDGGNYLTGGLTYDVLAKEYEGQISVLNDDGWVSYYSESDFKLSEKDSSISENVELGDAYKVFKAHADGCIEDMVNHPNHYTNSPAKCSDCGKGIECIDVTRHFSFNLGNAMKYIWRCDLKKDAIEDLKKAVFYLNDEIALREKNLEK